MSTDSFSGTHQTPFAAFHALLDDALNGVVENNIFAKITQHILKDPFLQKNSGVMQKVVKLLELSKDDTQLSDTDKNTVAAAAIACLSEQKVIRVPIAEKPYVLKEKTADHLNRLLYHDYLSMDNMAVAFKALARKSNRGGKDKNNHPRMFGSGDFDFFRTQRYFKTVFKEENKTVEDKHLVELQQTGFDILEDSLEKAIAIRYDYNFRGGGYVVNLLEYPIKYSNNDFLQAKAVKLQFDYTEKNKFEVTARKFFHGSLLKNLQETHPIEAAWLASKVELLVEEEKLKEIYKNFSHRMLNFSWGENYDEALSTVEQNIENFKKENDRVGDQRLALAYFPVPKLFAEQ